jgi:HSP20 family molecular chaperone IbpA
MSSFPFNQAEIESGVGEASQATDWGVTQASQESAFQPQVQHVASPEVDIVEAGELVIVYVDLPGYEADDVRVRIDQQTLLVDASRERELDESDTVVVRERPSLVERVITLPAVVRAGGAEAEINDGVCVISLPKAATDRYEEIHVTDD